MPFIGVQPADIVLASGSIGSNVIDSDHYVDGSIDTAHIGDDQITLAKIASGTDGELITWDASGNPAAVGAGTSGHFLKSQGAGSVPVFAAAASGAWKLLETETASGSAALDFTAFNSSLYSSYMFLIENIHPATDGRDLWIQTSTNAGSSFATSAYRWVNTENTVNPAITAKGHENDSAIRIMANDNTMGNAADEGVSGTVMLYAPENSALVTMFTSNIIVHTSGDNAESFTGGGMTAPSLVVDGVRFLLDDGSNMDTGVIRMLGMVK